MSENNNEALRVDHCKQALYVAALGQIVLGFAVSGEMEPPALRSFLHPGIFASKCEAIFDLVTARYLSAD